MLIGDYTFQCKKQIGLCTCKACLMEGLKNASISRTKSLYSKLLELSSKNLDNNLKELVK